MSHAPRRAKLGAVTQRALFRIAADREDELLAGLWRAGTIGVECRPAAGGELCVEAFFESAPPELEGFEAVESGAVPPRDWLAAWRASAQPIAVGRRFLLDPRESDQAAPDRGGRILLRVPARAAFGTGSHESTRLVLELMEDMDLAGRRVLDVGCGSGVLALAALALGARRAVGFDVDLVAPLLAAQNSDLNGLWPLYFAGAMAALAPAARFDVALVNVIPEEIRGHLAALRGCLSSGARAIFSGILGARGESALRVLRRHGFRRVATRRAGEWVAYLCEASA